MQEFAPIKMRDDFVREQWVMNVIDLICYSMLMSVPTVLYESPQNLGPREFDSLAIDAKKRIAALQVRIRIQKSIFPHFLTIICSWKRLLGVKRSC